MSRSLSSGAHSRDPLLLAMLGWTAPDGIDVPNWSLM